LGGLSARWAAYQNNPRNCEIKYLQIAADLVTYGGGDTLHSVAIRDGFFRRKTMMRNVEMREYKEAARQWYVERCKEYAAYVRALNRRIDSGATDWSVEERTLRVKLRRLDRSGAGHVRALLGVLDSAGVGD
jgi:hypothetical protein